MRVWSVTVAQTRRRRLLVPAADEKAAARAVRATLRAGERVETVQAPDAVVDAVDGRAALVWLFDQPFLPVLGRVQPLGHFANTATGGDAAAHTLAMAGLRWVEAQDLFIGSAVSVPWLAGRCAGTALQGLGLLTALAGIPGACKAGARTLAGVVTRGVIVPRDAALGALKTAVAA